MCPLPGEWRCTRCGAVEFFFKSQALLCHCEESVGDDAAIQSRYRIVGADWIAASPDTPRKDNTIQNSRRPQTP